MEYAKIVVARSIEISIVFKYIIIQAVANTRSTYYNYKRDNSIVFIVGSLPTCRCL